MKNFPRIFCLVVLNGVPALAAVLDGYVVRVDSATVYLDWGKTSGAQAGDAFKVYRPGELLRHPVTGELLGQAEETLGSGVLEKIEDKFSVGRLLETLKTLKAGDRTRWQQSPAAVPLPTSAEASPSPLPGRQAGPPSPALGRGSFQTGSLRELWRSEPMKEEAVGIALGDLDGDGQKEIVVAFRKKIGVFRWKENRLDAAATYDARAYRHWLAVDTGDLKRDGREEIFATVFLEGLNRPRVVVLRLADGNLKKEGDLEGFARSFNRSDGSRRLLWQNLSRSREMSFTAPSELTWTNGSYRPGPPLDLHLNDDQLFGFAWGNWNRDGVEDFAVLQHGERLRLISQRTKWTSSEVYGGSKNDFSTDENHVGSLCPRLLSWAGHPSVLHRSGIPWGSVQLIVPRNIPELGIRLTYLKLYKNAEMQGLVWNGLEMQPAWRLAIPGYLADFAVGDGLHASAPQLWLAVVGPGGKTVLISYSLP